MATSRDVVSPQAGGKENREKRLQSMTRVQLKKATRAFTEGETVIDITLTNGEIVSGVIFDGYEEGTAALGFIKTGQLHWKSGAGGGTGGTYSHGLIADVTLRAERQG